MAFLTISKLVGYLKSQFGISRESANTIVMPGSGGALAAIANGTSTAVASFGASAPTFFVGQDTGASAVAVFQASASDTSASTFGVAKSRGTGNSKTTVVTGDSLGSFLFYGYTNAFTPAANIDARCEGTISNGVVPCSLYFVTANSIGTRVDRWQINSSGHLLACTDNSWDIGASGATRPRTIYYGTQIVMPGGSTSAPALAFAGTTCGLYSRDLSTTMGFVSSSAVILEFEFPGLALNSGKQFMGSSNVTSVAADVGFVRADVGVWKVTNGSSGSGWLQNAAGRARVTADVTNATTTFSNVTDLTLTLIAGRKYVGRLVMFVSDSVTTEGWKLDFNGGAATFTSIAFGLIAQNGSPGTKYSTSASTPLTITDTVGSGVTTVVVEFECVCNAGGTLIPRFAQNSHASGTATLALGSYLMLEDSPT